MRTKSLVLWVITTLIGTIALPLTAIGSDSYTIPKEPLLAPEGIYVTGGVAEKFRYPTDEALKAWPGLIGAIQRAKKTFETNDVATFDVTTDLTKVFRTKSGKLLTVFSGCRGHDCGGHMAVIVYDQGFDKAYLLEEESKTLFRIHGGPNPEVLRLLVQNFFE